MPPKRKAPAKPKVAIEQEEMPAEDIQDDTPIKKQQKPKTNNEGSSRGAKKTVEKEPIGEPLEEETPDEVQEEIPNKKKNKSKTGSKTQNGANDEGSKEQAEIGIVLEEEMTSKSTKATNRKQKKPASPKDETAKGVKKPTGSKKANADVESAPQPDTEVPAKRQRKPKEPKESIEDKLEDNHVPPKEVSRRPVRVAKQLANIALEDLSEKEKEPKTRKTKKPDKKSEKEEETQPKGKTAKATKKPTKETKKAEPEPSLTNVSDTKWDEIEFGCDKNNPKGKNHNLKITSWNIGGLRAWLKKDGLNILNFDKPDILCLQEIKCSDDKLPEDVTSIEGYHDYWCASNKEGYAGVGVYSKTEPINVTYGIGEEKHDDEGRCITLEYKDFYLVNVYVPNAGRGLVTLPKRLEWNETFKTFIKKLDKKKPVIVCGDMNVAHNEIDLTNPKANKKNAGFTQEERDGMTDFLEDGYVDSYRELYPEKKEVYTFWSYMSKARPKNIGWRLDYFIVSNRIMENICDNTVRSEVYGSDHCPITLFMNI